MRVWGLSADNDYARCLYSALRACGVDVQACDWSFRWLSARARRGDIVCLHWPSFLYYEHGAPVRTWFLLLRFVVLMAFFRVRGVRYFWIAHNLYPHDGGRGVRAHRIGRRVVVALSSWIGVHGEAAGRRVQEEFGVGRRRLVRLEHGNWMSLQPNGISREEARRKLQVAPDAFVFLFFGLCKEYKNIVELVRSHRQVADGALLWIVGQFQSEAYYNEVVSATAGDPRVWIRNGRVEQDDVQIYFNACDVVALPYKEILTSGTVMSAFSFGRPVVVPRLEGMEEVVTTECGLLYDPNSKSALSMALRAARERKFDSGRILQHAQQFSWERSAQRFLEAVSQGATVGSA